MLVLSLNIGGTHIGCGVVRGNELLGSTSLDSEPTGSLGSDSWMAIFHVADRDCRIHARHVGGRMEGLWTPSYGRDHARNGDADPAIWHRRRLLCLR
jgi:hypothetical protein